MNRTRPTTLASVRLHGRDCSYARTYSIGERDAATRYEPLPDGRNRIGSLTVLLGVVVLFVAALWVIAKGWHL